MKKLAVLTACFHYNDEPIYRLQNTCEKFGVQFFYYGLREKFTNWRQAKLERLRQILPELVEQTEYILFTDGFDSFLLRDPEGLIEAFNSYNAPLLVSAEKSCAPIATLADEYPVSPTKFRFVNGGGFMGRTADVSRIVGTMEARYRNYHRPEFQFGNDQIDWTYAFLEKDLKIALDTQCKIFLSMGEVEPTEYEWDNKGLKVLESGEYPYVIHFNGPKGGDTINQKNMDTIYKRIYEQGTR